MNKNTSLILHVILILVALAELGGRLLDNINIEYLAKPLIMVWMALYFLLAVQKKTLILPVLLAFFFSWTGDLFLMFSGRDELFFYAGVGGFFCAQLTYIFVFTKYREAEGQGYLQQNPLVGLFFIAYLAGILVLLFPGLEGIMKPVILVYALSLIGMSMMALNRKLRVSHASFLPVFAGSLFFVASDSMIAIDKFHTQIPMAGFWIMLTYISAQYLIMRGLAREGQS